MSLWTPLSYILIVKTYCTKLMLVVIKINKNLRTKYTKVMINMMMYSIYIDEGSIDLSMCQCIDVDKIQQTPMSLCVNV